MPRSLAKCGERKRMRIYDAIVRFVGGKYVRQQFWPEYLGSGQGGLERPESAKDLVSVVTGHSYGGNVARLLADVEGSGEAHIGATVRQVNGPFGELRKSRQKICTDLNHLVRLAACSSHPACNHNVPAVTIKSSKRVARQ